jgi:hypothetical protein
MGDQGAAHILVCYFHFIPDLQILQGSLGLGFRNHFAIGGDSENLGERQRLNGHGHSIDIEIRQLSGKDGLGFVGGLPVSGVKQKSEQRQDRCENGSLEAMNLHIELSG